MFKVTWQLRQMTGALSLPKTQAFRTRAGADRKAVSLRSNPHICGVQVSGS